MPIAEHAYLMHNISNLVIQEDIRTYSIKKFEDSLNKELLGSPEETKINFEKRE